MINIVKVQYEIVDSCGNICDNTQRGSREIQLIFARKPVDIGEMHAEELLKKLELEIKQIEEHEKLNVLKIEGATEKSKAIDEGAKVKE